MVPGETSTALLESNLLWAQVFSDAQHGSFRGQASTPFPMEGTSRRFRGNTQMPVCYQSCSDTPVVPGTWVLLVWKPCPAQTDRAGMLRERGGAQRTAQRCRCHHLWAETWSSSHCSICSCSTSDSRTLSFASRWRPDIILVGEGFLQSQSIQCPLGDLSGTPQISVQSLRSERPNSPCFVTLISVSQKGSWSWFGHEVMHPPAPPLTWMVASNKPRQLNHCNNFPSPKFFAISSST